MKANEDHGCQSRTFDDLRRSNSPDGEHLGKWSEKKRDYVGKIPKWQTPLQFGKPLLSKKKLGLFFILKPQEHFWSSPKNHNFK